MAGAVIDYLELIKSRAKGFVYRLASEAILVPGMSNRRKLLGVLWQTATMRRNFELFGGYLCLDMMMRGLNTLAWPYVAAAMYDDDDKLVIGCEGILCGERVDMYGCLSKFMEDYSPGRPLSTVEVVSGDAFFDQDMVVLLGFVNAAFITDQHHLIDSGLDKKFGKGASGILKGHLIAMIRAPTENVFDTTLQSARELLESQTPRNGQWESDLIEFAGLKNTYSQYCLDKIPGNRGRHGNQVSESNHVSALCYLNDGNKKGNTFCEHPIVLIRQLLKRQKKHVNACNGRLFGNSSKLTIERFRLQQAPSTPANMDLINAASALNFYEYEKYKGYQGRANEDLAMTQEYDDSIGLTITSVSSVRYPDAPPRIFRRDQDRCDCIERLKDLVMCSHEIKAKGGFRHEFFQPRHFYRHCVSGSLEGWVETEDHVDNILGYQLVAS